MAPPASVVLRPVAVWGRSSRCDALVTHLNHFIYIHMRKKNIFRMLNATGKSDVLDPWTLIQTLDPAPTKPTIYFGLDQLWYSWGCLTGAYKYNNQSWEHLIVILFQTIQKGFSTKPCLAHSIPCARTRVVLLGEAERPVTGKTADGPYRTDPCMRR